MWSLYCVLFTPNRCHTGMLCIIGNNNNNSNKPTTTTPATGTNKQLWQQCDIGNQFVPTTGNSICKSAIVAGSRCASAFIYICMCVRVRVHVQILWDSIKCKNAVECHVHMYVCVCVATDVLLPQWQWCCLVLLLLLLFVLFYAFDFAFKCAVRQRSQSCVNYAAANIGQVIERATTATTTTKRTFVHA